MSTTPKLNFAAVHITAGSFSGRRRHPDRQRPDTSGTTVTGITFLWNPTLHTLVLTGASSVANYQAVLQTVQFQSDEPQSHRLQRESQRTLTWSVSDGTTIVTTSLYGRRSISPAVERPPDQYRAGRTERRRGHDPADCWRLGGGQRQQRAHHHAQWCRAAALTVTADRVSGNGTASVTITATQAQINAALTGLAYRGNVDFNGGDTLMVAADDGTATDTDPSRSRSMR